jgi:hypothetical protein
MENMAWDFGSMQPKITIDNGQLNWSIFGGQRGGFPLRSVTGISYESKGVFSVMAKVSIMASGSDGKKLEVPKNAKSEQIVNNINAYLSEIQNKKSQDYAVSKSPSIADEIQKLASLKERGLLTEDEFQQQKLKLLK